MKTTMDDLPSLTTSSSNPSSFYDPNSQSEERLMPQKDSQESSKRSVSTLEEKDGYIYQEIQKFHMINEVFDSKNALATEKLTIKKRPCLLIEESENKKKKRKMPEKMDRVAVVNDDETEWLKRFITGEMNGLDMRLLIQKTLYESDINKNQNRLNMPIKQLLAHPDEFLTTNEKRMVDESKEGIGVKVVGPMMRMYEKSLWLKTWHMKHTDNYVLKKNWNNFVADNKVLKKGTMIQVWAFRKDGQLCFAIVPVEKTDAVDQGQFTIFGGLERTLKLWPFF